MNSTLSRIDAPLPPIVSSRFALLADYYELTKPRIIGLLLVTTYAAMIMAAHGLPPLGITIVTLFAGALAAGSAGAFNCVIDRDIDRLMRRTMHRPVATGRIGVVPALIFAVVLEIISFTLLYTHANPLAAWLSLSGNVYYVVIYTLWLKRTTSYNIVIGGAAGSIPPLVGWAAMTNHIDAPALALFALIFLWTPPHFWALALMTETDYDRAKIPMLPNVHGIERTKREILIYTIVMVLMSLSLTPLGILGLWYFFPAAILGGIFIADAVRLLHGPTAPLARMTFKYSLLYLALMCVAMVADRIIS
ncbi:MAG TPA: heme o synthase [Candidatus Baltobacteraceae bacterium]|nr:heme o synthase [Candidatus Baltobacteraceae bacterium]